MGGLTASGIVRVPLEPVPKWEIAPGVVDYDKVEFGKLTGPSPHVLKVAQWYDYWPGSFLLDFQKYIKQTYNLDVSVQWDVFTSNEELFEWITLGKRRYDVFVPSNYVTDLMKNGNLVYNLNLDWIPNFKNLDPTMVSYPKDNPFDRQGPTGDYVSVPYFWGTTGIGFRSDRIPKEEVEELGFDLFWMESYTPKDGRFPKVELKKKMRLLDDERDVIGWGLKKGGWEEQLSRGLSPTGIPGNPDAPYNAQFQWTTNETQTAKLAAARKWLFAAKPNIFDFNSTEDVASLAGGSAVVNQAWSGDIMYGKRPDQNQPLPVDYVIPKQGSTWWIDTVAIHSKCRNLWLAHEFLNFIHSVEKPWEENQLLTRWNLYSTPNKVCYDKLWDWEHSPAGGFASGWKMTEEPILYPDIYAPEDFHRCDASGDVGLKALLNLYNPLWFDLTG